jgi:plasmid rolling circle replication initiator protein Rep
MPEIDQDGSTAFLADISPKDKPWDIHKGQSRDVAALYAAADYGRLSERVTPCSDRLGFGWHRQPETGEQKIRLRAARFCRVRFCPTCQWRRSLMWTARFLRALPAIETDFPKARYVFLTLTVKNCPVSDLKATLTEMNRAWQRLSQKKVWPAIGFVRSVEVTRGADGSAHPHFHALLMVQGSYFQGKYYLSQKDWSELWQKALKVDYCPVVDVRAIKPNPKRSEGNFSPVQSALAETLKYSVKPDDLVTDQDWLAELTKQLHKTRAVTLGGVFKNYLSEEEPEDLINTDELDFEGLIDTGETITFGWIEKLKRYQKE